MVTVYDISPDAYHIGVRFDRCHAHKGYRVAVCHGPIHAKNARSIRNPRIRARDFNLRHIMILPISFPGSRDGPIRLYRICSALPILQLGFNANACARGRAVRDRVHTILPFACHCHIQRGPVYIRPCRAVPATAIPCRLTLDAIDGCNRRLLHPLRVHN